MLDSRWDIGKDDIEQVQDKIDDPALHTSKFINDKGFYIFSKTIEDKHIDQQVCPVCMDKTRS